MDFKANGPQATNWLAYSSQIEMEPCPSMLVNFPTKHSNHSALKLPDKFCYYWEEKYTIWKNDEQHYFI